MELPEAALSSCYPEIPILVPASAVRDDAHTMDALFGNVGFTSPLWHCVDATGPPPSHLPLDTLSQSQTSCWTAMGDDLCLLHHTELGSSQSGCPKCQQGALSAWHSMLPSAMLPWVLMLLHAEADLQANLFYME